MAGKPGIKGAQKHSQRLSAAASSAAAQAVARGLYAAGQIIEIEAEHSITQGSISGANHVPSRPGEPPNADTRFLDTHIETYVAGQNPPTVHVESQAPYSAALEFGTSKMIERPFMRPAVSRKRGEAAKLVGQALSTTIRRG